MNKTILALVAILTTLTLTGCAAGYAPTLAAPNQLSAPQHIDGNTGAYMTPYTSDGVLAEWVNNSVNAEM